METINLYDLLLIVYLTGSILVIMLFWIFRSFVDNDMRCSSLVYIPLAMLSFTTLILALVLLTLVAIEERKYRYDR